MSNPVCHVCMCPILTLFSKTILQPNREFSCCSSLHFWLDEKRTQKGQNLHLALTFCSQTVTHDVPFCKIKTFVPQLIHSFQYVRNILHIQGRTAMCPDCHHTRKPTVCTGTHGRAVQRAADIVVKVICTGKSLSNRDTTENRSWDSVALSVSRDFTFRLD